MTKNPDPSLDAPTIVGHRPSGLLQARAPAAPPVPEIPRGVPPPAPPPQRPIRAVPPSPSIRPASGSPDDQLPVRQRPRELNAEAARVTLQLANDPGRESEAIVAAAGPLLVLVAQLRNAVEFADVQTLRTEVVNQIQKFEETAIKFGARATDVTAARYILCSLIDETVMTTPWGSASTWSSSSLLNRFHNETWGGEKVFAILDRVRGDPKKNLALLKLIDLTLVLGFEGMHRVLDGGRERLADLREQVGALVAAHSGSTPSELSEEWRGIGEKRTLRTYLPLWVVFALTGFLLVCVYGVQKYRVSVAVAPVVEQLHGLATTKPQTETSR